MTSFGRRRPPSSLVVPVLLALLGACRSQGTGTTPTGTQQPQPPPRLDEPEHSESSTLDCATVPCKAIEAQLAELCALVGTNVRRGSIGTYTVVTAKTDPTSFLYTSSTYVFDRKGKMVGRTSFVNEYGRSNKEGIVPVGQLGNERDACPGKLAPAPAPAT